MGLAGAGWDGLVGSGPMFMFNNNFVFMEFKMLKIKNHFSSSLAPFANMSVVPDSSWEAADPSWDNAVGADAHGGAGADDDEVWGQCSDSDGDHDVPPPTPFDELLSFMVSLLFMGTLSARQFCVILYWCGKCGITAAVPWGMRPSAQSGKFAPHVERKLGHVSVKRKLYRFEVPGYNRHDMERTRHVLHMNPAHEQAAKSMADPSFETTLLDKRDRMELPPNYYDHPVVVAAAGAAVAAYALFVDAVPYTLTDSIIGFWLVCLVTSRRYLIAVLRKRCTCKCGCRGWCSFYVIWYVIRWSLGILARGVYPTHRHDGSDWQSSDAERARVAGTAMPMRAAVCYIKGDWAEYGSTIALPLWNDSVRPCFECNAIGNSMWISSHTCDNFKCRLNGDLDYAAACARAEIHVELTRRTRAICVDALRYDRRNDGAHGLALTRDIIELGLRRDDRLEPSEHLLDISLLREVPLEGDDTIKVVFWRSSNESLARHRNPILDAEIGLSPKRALSIDPLHCLYLGVFRIWCMVVIWKLIVNHAYARVGTAEENLVATAMVIRKHLLNFYVQRHSDRPLEGLTRVADVTPKMFGTSNDQKCKVKGAECWGLMLFLVHELRRLGSRAGAHWNELLMAGECLVRMIDVWNNNGTRIPQGDIDECFRLYNQHMALMQPFDEFVPKHHIVYHLLLKMVVHGNPKETATWKDEALNKLLKSCCKNASQATFEPTVLVRMAELLEQSP